VSWWGLASLALLAGTACTKEAPSDGGAPPREVIATELALGDAAAPARPRTTSPEIALGNLDAQIRGRQAIVNRDPNDVASARPLVDLLLFRGQFRGIVADYELAEATALSLVSAHPEAGDAHLMHAATLGAFHLFRRALDELDAAEHTHADHGAVLLARATILIAQGRYDEADALGALRAGGGALDPGELTTAAVLAGERGRAAESQRLFDQARASYRDVSPFTFAWIDFQQASLFERRGDRLAAKRYFAEAREMMPTFAHACVHLAALEAPDRARSLLEPLLGQSDDPEVDAAYGDAIRRLGRNDEAKAFIDRARSRYDELVAKHAEAFADHAALFYLGDGSDPAKALALAKINAANRATEPALQLLIVSALAAGSNDDACSAVVRATALRYATSALRFTVDALRDRCVRPRAMSCSR
jgi:tetratricopeptide (TPR) repeat protein